MQKNQNTTIFKKSITEAKKATAMLDFTVFR